MHPKYARLVPRSPGLHTKKKRFFVLKPKFFKKPILITLCVVLLLMSFQRFLPPSKAYAAPWSPTHGSYLSRKQLTLVNNSGQTFESGTTYKVTIDTQSLVSSGSLLTTCDDLRIVYQPSDTQAVELKRNVEYASTSSTVTTCATSSATQVVFQLQADIANTGTDANYYIYYDNPDATTYPAADALAAYNVGAKTATFVAPFNGTTTALAAGSGTPTTATGAIRYSGGKSALSFDGAGDNTTIATASDGDVDFNGTEKFSLETWVYVSSIPATGTSQAIISKWDSTSTIRGYYLALTNDDSDATGNIEARLYDESADQYITAVSANDSIAQNTWYHIALTFNGGTAGTANDLNLYVNGNTVDGNDANGSFLGLEDVAADFVIGDWDATDVVSTNTSFSGFIDEVRVSNTVRYTSNFTPQTTPFVRDEYTKLLLHFDENGDDPRNTGKAIDDSGNGNHGTITGAKYVGGLVGVDGATSSPTETGYQSSQSYASHNGIFIEEGTTNLITNPSFDHATYGTNWTMADGTTNYNSAIDTFTPNIAKRNSAGPFAAGVTTQGDLVNGESLTDDVLSTPYGTQINGNFYTNFDTTQGSVVLWWTPEYAYNASAGAGLHYIWYVSSDYYLAYDYANDRFEQKVGGQTITSARNIASGTTYNLVTNWNTQNVLAGSDYQCFTIDDGTPACGTTQPTASAPASTIYIGSNGTTGASSGIIEGLTVYRRPLYDGTNGINVGNGDEVNLIMTGGSAYDGTHTGANNAATLTDSGFTASALINRTIYNTTDGSSCLITANTTTTVTCTLAGGSENDWDTGDAYKINFGQDPTLITGSWDVVFDLPTNATTGALTTGTGNAWSHPHASNLLYTDATNTGGFMMNGTYTSDGWADEGTPTAVSALATGEKIFAGGYKTTSDTANEGISYTKAATSGNDYVLRALGNSDGTCSPQILITRADGTTEISHLNGTTASTRTAPNSYVFTWEAPATENMIVKLINTASTGTCYWHQVEVLANLVTNPSMDTGAVADPWIPTGWTNTSLATGEGVQETTIVRSGVSSMKLNISGGTFRGISLYFSSSPNFVYMGNWAYESSGNLYMQFESKYRIQSSNSGAYSLSASGASWNLYHGVGYKSTPAGSQHYLRASTNPAVGYYDDAFAVSLTDISLTATPASEANSTQTSGLRVDGADTLTQPVTGLTDKSGEITLKYTPRHTITDSYKFGSSNSIIFKAYGDSNDYLRLYHSNSTWHTLQAYFSGSQVIANFSTTLTPGTTYTLRIKYLTGGNLTIDIDGVNVASGSVGAFAFSTVPNTIYFGSDETGQNQADGTFSAAVVTNPAPSENTTAPYYKFGSKSAKLTATATDAGLYTTSINPASTSTHTLSSYVYDGTSANVGGTVDSKVASLIFGGTYPTTTYTDMGGGWWRLTASATPGLLEQNPTNLQDTDQGLYTTTSNKYLSQGIKVSSSTTIDKALLYIKKVGAGTPTTTHYQVEIQTDSTGVPSGTPVTNGTSACTAVATSTSYANITFTFATAPSLTSGTQYHLVLKPYTNSGCSTGQSAIDATNYLSWGYDNTASFYANGDRATMNTSNAWTVGTNTDHQFQLYSPNQSQTYGVVVNTGKIAYVDGVQLEQNVIATTYADGTLGSSYAWTGTAHDSTSTRTKGDLRYNSTSNISNAKGAVSMWIQPLQNPINLSHSSYTLFDLAPSSGNLGRVVGTVAYNNGSVELSTWDSSNAQKAAVAGTVNSNKWYHIVFNWDNTDGIQVFLNGSGGTKNSTTWTTAASGTTLGIGNNFGGTIQSDFVIEGARFYNTTLTTTEITDLYNAGLGSQTSLAPTSTERYTDGQPPVVVWHLDEGYGTSAYDSTLQLNHGTISGSTFSEDSSGGGHDSKSLRFDGVDDKISRTYSNDSELNPGTNNFSISTWFKSPSTITGTDTLISRYNGAGYKLYMNSSGFVCFDIDDDSTWSPDDSACTTVSFADSSWHQALAVKGTSSIILYIDGVQRSTDATLAATGSLSGSTPTLYAGIDSDGTSNPWAGFMDEIRIYDSQRSAEQIKQEYIARGTNKGVSATLGGEGATEGLDKGLVGYWKMDESSGSRVDSSGNNNTLSDTNSVSSGTGKFSLAGDFVPASTQYLSIADNASLSMGDIDFSIGGWVYVDNATADQGVFGKYSSNREYLVAIYQSKFYFYYSSNGTVNSGIATSAILSAGNWYHVMAQHDSKNNKTMVYVNGKLEASAAYSNGVFDGSNNFEVGKYLSGQYFDGKVDELRVYKRVLSPAEVRALYEYAPGPIAQFKMDEGSWSGNGAVIDSSGNANALTHKGNAQIASPGKFGKGSVYDGTGDYLCSDANTDGTCDDDDGFDFGTGSFSVEGWFKRPTTAAQNNLVTKAQAGTNEGYKVYMASDGDICFDIDDDSTWTPDDTACTTAATYDDNNWHYFSAVKNGTTSISISIDGVLITTDATIAATATLSSDDPLYIGIDDNASSNPFTGNLDDIKFYNYARTQKQIVQDLNAGHPAVGSPVGSAIAHYKFDEGTDNKCTGGVNDVCNSGSGGSALDGAQSGMAVPATATSGWTNSGKLGKGLIFDGTDDKVSFGNPINLRDGTISVWIKWNGSPRAIFSGGSYTEGYWFYLTGGNIVMNWGSDNDSFANPFSIGVWTHVVSTRSGSIVKLYKDGVLKETKDVGTANQATIRCIGEMYCGGSVFQRLDGSIDEVKIYNYALSEDEIKLDYNQGKAIVMGNTGTASDGKTADNSASRAYCPPGNTEGNCAVGQNPAPVAEWNMDEGSGTTTQDTSGNNNTGTLTNGPTWTNGKVGKALNFDGSNDYVDAGNGSSVQLGTKDMTLEAWIKIDTSVASNRSLVDKGAGTGRFWLFYANGASSLSINSYFGVGYDYYANASANVKDNKWHYVVATFDRDGYQRIYVDGIWQHQTSIAPAAAISWDSTTAVKFSSGQLGYLKGQLDGVRVYDYIRTPTQIAWDYNKGAPVVYYRFDECSGATANNAAPAGQGDSGNDATIYPASNDNTAVGTCNSGTATEMWNDGSTGKYSSALGLDGNDDYAATANAALVTVNAYSYTSASWGGWFYPSTSPTSDTLMHKGNEFRLTTDASAYPQCELYSGSWQPAAADTTALPATTWSHVLCTYDGVNIKLYVNGILKKTVAETDAITSSSSTALSVGRDSAGSGYFGGLIDEAKVWRYALSNVQVHDAYAGGAVSFK